MASLVGPVIGIGAALLAPLLMTVGFVVWDKYWQGSAFALNVFKCGLASVLFVVTLLAMYVGDVRAAAAPYTAESTGFLVLSAFLGITVGDAAWLQALRLLGAKRVIIIDTLKPFLAAVLGALFLHEALSFVTALGVALTSAGVLVVSLEKERVASPNLDPDPTQAIADTAHAVNDPTFIDPGSLDPEALLPLPVAPKRSPVGIGYALAVANVVLDAVGALLVKRFASDVPPFHICLVRFGSAFLTVALLWGAVRLTVELGPKPCARFSGDASWCRLPAQGRTVWARIAVGVVFVTFFCPALSNVALLALPLALALTLTAVGPLYALPLVWVMKGERLTVRALAGAVLAVAGVAILCATQAS
jgi:drug/metabolite transporter (DMT)-like permease